MAAAPLLLTMRGKTAIERSSTTRPRTAKLSESSGVMEPPTEPSESRRMKAMGYDEGSVGHSCGSFHVKQYAGRADV